VRLDIYLDPAELAPGGATDAETLSRADYGGMIKQTLRDQFPEASGRREKRDLYALVSSGAAYDLRDRVMADPDLVGETLSIWVPADDDVDVLLKGKMDRNAPEDERRLKDHQISWIEKWEASGDIERRFNTTFFTAGDSREPELAGIRGALMGSFYTLIVTLLLSFPIGIAAAIYLEEFAPKNKWTDIIEVNINNLAAVPSIVFGLLGLAVFLNFFGLPRSVPLVGGLVLTLMTLPTIIIASRAALKSVPPSIREAALGVGASKNQMVFHHVLPLAMPGMLTGTIIGMAQALGETAPLLMIGMIAFIVDVPGGFTDPSTVLPVQIFLWSDSPERAFVERTSAAIMVLLAFLISMNLIAVLLRKRFERTW
jgi:phosphate transport system permease protein